MSLLPEDSQRISSNLAPLLQVLERAGIAEADIASHLADLIKVKAETAIVGGERQKKHYLDQTFFIPGEDAFIYRRADTKKQLWYLRMYDPRDKKNIVRSLGTTDLSFAQVKAREIWSEVTQKIRHNQRIVSITTQQLVDRYLNAESKHLAHVPKQGITPASFANKQKHLKKWIVFIDELGLSKCPIDQIDPEKIGGDAFAKWVLSRPQRYTYQNRPRSRDAVNGHVSQVIRMYKRFAVTQRLIGQNQIPYLEYLKIQEDGQHKRDILTIEEYSTLWRWMQDKWCRGRTLQRYDKRTKQWIPCLADDEGAQWRKDDSISERELQRRIVFEKLFGIFNNTGMRPKELLGLRSKDILATDNPDKEIQEKCLTLVVLASNSKTGKGRRVVAPIKKRVNAIKIAYADAGLDHFLNPDSENLFFLDPKDGQPWTQRKLRLLLDEVLRGSGLKSGRASDKNITLYSSRHLYATLRLRAGVDRALVAKNMGTSILQLEKTYGHIETEVSAVDLLRGQGCFARGADLMDIEMRS